MAPTSPSKLLGSTPVKVWQSDFSVECEDTTQKGLGDQRVALRAYADSRDLTVELVTAAEGILTCQVAQVRGWMKGKP